jgi:PAS domain S-box-containing protein
MNDAAAWRNRFTTLLDRIPLPIGVCHADGTLLSVNPAFAEILGTTPMKLRRRPVAELLKPADDHEYERVLADLRTRRRRRVDLAVHWPTGAGTLTIQVVNDQAAPGLLLTLTPTATTRPPDLTERELSVLRLIASGATSAQAADQLGLTPDGVNYHLNRLTAQLRVPNRVALIARAYTLGILNPTAWPPN